MGCLNSKGQFNHWFGNIHLSGPCNRRCYFCIGQHMMALDSLNNLNKWPLAGLDGFAESCDQHEVFSVNLTGTNTDPLLYNHISKLRDWMNDRMPMVPLAIRTNGILWSRPDKRQEFMLFDKASVTVCSLNSKINAAMMGGPPPPIADILETCGPKMDIKVNIVLGPENYEEIPYTLRMLESMGCLRVNLREPYGQPHVGCPIKEEFVGDVLGMPLYRIGDMDVLYWDVHYCEVESINLYANGRISEDYPITRGHDPSGMVLDQTNFQQGRMREQWLGS